MHAGARRITMVAVAAGDPLPSGAAVTAAITARFVSKRSRRSAAASMLAPVPLAGRPPLPPVPATSKQG
ncbi:hypothetical protein HXX76_005698 [Chlamydomonas incerta]|uniref:Uncharacterized protein n=1 Tax=Chlamydomonas incerta TaxID=51695 RepID=A0A835W5P7_CHLIN|nr:hypothetical protein HXX76_005698 [Chlamydomonas incerta]|eukprot:KAG2438089.1 hypothetical protein HXX76_005698 [Chlamydomonas incerta]